MIIALIPARGGSTRVPKKNLQLIGNHSLVGWAVMAANAVDLIDRTYVSTEDNEIASEAMKYDCSVVERDPAAATNEATDRDVILDFLGKTHGEIDLIVYLRPTTPLRLTMDIYNAISTMLQIKATGLRSIHEMSESAHKCFGMLSGNILHLAFSSPFNPDTNVDRANYPNQSYPKTYSPNGVVDIVRPEICMQDGKTFGNKVYGYLTAPVIEIDRQEDLEYARFRHAAAGNQFTFIRQR